jgi:multiple sugar transport system permease protein
MATDMATRLPRTAAHAAVRRRRRPDGLIRFGVFAAPGLLVYLCFVLAPILISVAYSLTNYNPFISGTEFKK